MNFIDAKRSNHTMFTIVWSIGIIVLLAVMAAGCVNTNKMTVEGKVNVVTSFYPLYDFAKKIGGDQVDVVNLVPTGVEPHDWSPKARDMKNIVNADIFVYNGADFEGWVHDFLDSIDPERGLIVTEASKGVELIAASDEEHAEDGTHADADLAEEEDHEHGEFDPHIWLSPKQAKVMAANIRDALVKADPASSAEYEANYIALIDQLELLNVRLAEIVGKAEKKEIVVSHEAFGYIARDYDITQVGVMGLSPEAEPTVQKMKEITDFAKEHDIQYILFEELVSSRLAETLAESLGIQTLVLNPIEGLTEEQLKAGDDYFTLMENNLTTIEKALQ